MFSINFSRFAGMATKKVVTASSMLAMLFAFANVNAQTTFTFNPENFLIPPSPSVTECTGDACGGEIFLRMGTPVIEGGNASIGIWLRVESALGDTVPYLGNYTFHVATGGPGITLGRTECSFELAEGVQSDYAPAGLPVGTTDPFSITVSGVAPGFGIRPPSDDSHYTLKTEFEQFGTFSCPVANENGVNAYILAPSNVFGFTIQAGGGDQRQLLLRAANSFRYYPLTGEPSFVFTGTPDGGDNTEFTLNVVNNLTNVASTITNFVFTDTCGERTSAPVDTPTVREGGVTDITIQFTQSQTPNACSVTYRVDLPDGSFREYTQVITRGEPPTATEFLDASMVNYNDYLASFVARPDGGTVEAGDYVNADVAAFFAAATEQEKLQLHGGLSGEDIQQRLNDAVSAANIQLPATARVMNAYNFAGNVLDAGVPGSTISFVIDLADDNVGEENRVSTLRLIKLISGELMGVSDGDGNSVRYSRMLLGAPAGCPTEPNLWMSTTIRDNVAVIPMHQAPINCIMITIVDDGVYDESADMGRISDPLSAALASQADPEKIKDAIRGGGGGGGGNGFLGIGSAGAWTIMALLTVLGLSMLRRRRVTVRSEL